MRAAIFAIAWCMVASFAFAGTARAVDSARVGQVGVNVNQLACVCTAYQFFEEVGAPNSYRFPFSGIVTQYSLRVGVNPTTPETVQLRSFRQGSGNNATVISQGGIRSIPNASAGQIETFFDRVPVSANDILGGKWPTTANVNFTSFRFQVTNPGDQVSDLSAATTVNPGEEHTYPTSVSPQRINMQALVEPDADGDQYGDESQDFCSADVGKHFAPCSGTLRGSGIRVTDPVDFGIPGLPRILLQRDLDGASTAAPFDGVIVRWRVRAASSFTSKLAVVRFESSSGAGDQYRVKRYGEPVALTYSAARRNKVETFPARVPIFAGEYIGVLQGGLLSAVGTGAQTAEVHMDAQPPGVIAHQPDPPTNTEIAYSADIEPDADRDGYGDITQDSCPTDGAVQLACTLPAPNAAPAITGLKFKHSKFRVKKKGAVLKTSKSSAGTSFALTLSQAANVQFQIANKLKGKRSGSKCVKRTTKNIKKKNCTYLRNVFAFKRALSAGRSSLAFSGRYQRAKKNVALKPGSYRLTAIPSNAIGGVGKMSSTDVRVVKQ
ncbi:MAG: hypothetical protein ACRDKE_03445 [Solirubrobacterales bacterium]